MNTFGLTLLVPDKPDVERDAVATAFEASGGTVTHLGRFWDPPPMAAQTIRVYGNETFCLVLQEKLGLTLETPSDDLTTKVDAEFLRRRLCKSRLDDVLGATFPLFVKSLVPKQIPSRVYGSAQELAAASVGMEPETELIVADPVNFSAEVRAFVLDGVILDAALYEGDAPLAAARDFIRRLLATVRLPRTVVIDVGLLPDNGWALVEFNSAWGAGLNGCDALLVLPAIVAASTPDCKSPIS